MAKKTCNVYQFSLRHIDKLIDKIDERTKNGKDRENVDSTWQKHTINKEGDRVWSF